MIWSFYELEIIIHHTCSPERFPRSSAQGYEATLSSLISKGILRIDEDEIIRATEMGIAFGNMLKSTPLPVHRFVDPRFDALEE